MIIIDPLSAEKASLNFPFHIHGFSTVGVCGYKIRYGVTASQIKVSQQTNQRLQHQNNDSTNHQSIHKQSLQQSIQQRGPHKGIPGILRGSLVFIDNHRVIIVMAISRSISLTTSFISLLCVLLSAMDNLLTLQSR